jgi:1-acyl-sn-glycerol-3-phosphate acyltransferase
MKQTNSLTPTSHLIRALRCARLGLHFLAGACAIAFVYPSVGENRRLWLKQRWSRQLLDILGIRLDAKLAGFAPGNLIVANHISWLDIHALNAALPMAFVAKSELRRWPLVGWLATNTDTIFLRRGSPGDARLVNAEIGAMLKAGKDVAIFPEGTSTDGTQILNFHSALFQAAVDTGRAVQPVALSYYDAVGRRSLAPAYWGDVTMGECFAAILACRSLTVRLRPTPALDPRIRQRRELAHAARGAIAFNLGVPPGNIPTEASRAQPGQELSDETQPDNPDSDPARQA